MRDINRIHPFCEKIADIWATHSFFVDQRFGQLMSNFFGWLMSEKGIDLFFPEENKMLEYFKEYAEKHGGWKINE